MQRIKLSKKIINIKYKLIWDYPIIINMFFTIKIINIDFRYAKKFNKHNNNNSRIYFLGA